MALAAKHHKFTYEDYRKLPDEPRVELIEGEFLLSPAPNARHQIAAANIFGELYQWVKNHDLGLLLFAPTDVVLSNHNAVQPDILFVAKSHQNIIHDTIDGPPDLVVEILSPNYRSRDTKVKKGIYEVHGVREYWIVDPKSQTISVMILRDGKFQVRSNYAGDDVLESTVVKGFKLSLHNVFSR